MGYYTVDISLNSKYMIAIVYKPGTFRYNGLQMSMSISGDVFWDILSKILGDFKGAKTYIYDILFLEEIFRIVVYNIKKLYFICYSRYHCNSILIRLF